MLQRIWHVWIVKWCLYFYICKRFFEPYLKNACALLMAKYNSTLLNCSWNSFCHVSGIWLCTKLVPLVLEMPDFFKSWLQVRAVAAWATTLEQDVASSQGTLLRAPGQPGWHVKPGTKTWQMFDFPEPPQHLRLTWAQISLSPAMLQHFHPLCSFLLLGAELCMVTPFSQLSYMWGDVFAATLKCFLLLLGSSFYISLLVLFAVLLSRLSCYYCPMCV